MWTYTHQTELYHHGVKGMKWGKRRYQNPDGSLKPAGRKQQAKLDAKAARENDKTAKWQSKELATNAKKHMTAKYQKYAVKSQAKLDKAMESGKASDKKIAKLKKDLASKKMTAYYQAGLEKLEASKIKKMNLSDVKQEKKKIGQDKALSALSIVGAAAVAAVGGVGVYRTTDKNSLKTNLRTSEADRAKLYAKSHARAVKEVYG